MSSAIEIDQKISQFYFVIEDFFYNKIRLENFDGVLTYYTGYKLRYVVIDNISEYSYDNYIIIPLRTGDDIKKHTGKMLHIYACGDKCTYQFIDTKIAVQSSIKYNEYGKLVDVTGEEGDDEDIYDFFAHENQICKCESCDTCDTCDLCDLCDTCDTCDPCDLCDSC